MDYDSWRLESPEDEDERLHGADRRRRARLEYLADHPEELSDNDEEWFEARTGEGKQE
jgi:hypothetical protein